MQSRKERRGKSYKLMKKGFILPRPLCEFAPRLKAPTFGCVNKLFKGGLPLFELYVRRYLPYD